MIVMRKSGNVLWLIGLESRSSLRDLSVLASVKLTQPTISVVHFKGCE